MESDYLEKCHELLQRLNQAEMRLSENVSRLAERSEINEGQEKERVSDLMKNI